MIAPLRLAATSALLVLSSAAFGQAAPLAGVPLAPTFTIPGPTCDKPPTRAGLNPTPAEQKRWNKSIEEYKKCMVAYKDALTESAKGYANDYQQLVDAANKLLSDFNAYAAQVRKDNDMDDDDDSSKK